MNIINQFESKDDNMDLINLLNDTFDYKKPFYTIYYYNNIFIFGFYGEPYPDISLNFRKEYYTEDNLPQNLFSSYIINLNETFSPTENVIFKRRTQSFMSNNFIFFSNRKYAQYYSKSFCNFQYTIRNITNDSNNIEVLQGNEIREKIFQVPSFFIDYEINMFSSSNLLYIYLNSYNTNKKIRNIEQNFKYSIYIDGSYNIEKKLYAWAFVVYKIEENSKKEIYFDKCVEYNKKYKKHGALIAELLAMYHAHIYLLQNKINNIVIFYDNMNNYEMMFEKNLSNIPSESISPILLEIFTKYYNAMYPLQMQIISKKINVQYFHSKGHSGIEGNERADFLAKKAIRDSYILF